MLLIDHLIYGAPDLETGVRSLEVLLGVRAAGGGRHPAWGTHNALLALGGVAYLEVMAPDPNPPGPDRPRPLGLDQLSAPRLLTWAARGVRLERLVDRAATAGLDLGAVQAGSRRRSDGSVLSWRMTDLEAPRLGGVVPFFIDWGSSPHPASTAPGGCSIVALRGKHPEPERARTVLRALDLDLLIDPGPAPALIATIRSPRGDVDLS